MLVVHSKFHVIPFVNLYRFLERQELCDATFKFPCGRLYKAHKVVLRLNSEYFQALFRSNYRESLTGEVSVVDIPYQLFVDVVGYLYTGMIPASYCTTSGFESFCLMCEIANHYSSDNLQTYCERLIIARLDLCNAMSLYVWSKSVNLPNLKKVSLTFMTNNWGTCANFRRW